MAIYYGILGWLALCAVILRYFQERPRKVLSFLSTVIPLTVIAAGRGMTVGTDTVQYSHAVQVLQGLGYPQFESRNLYTNYEFGFTLLLRFCSLFHDPVRVMIVISSLIILVIPFLVISLISDNPQYAYLAYYLLTGYYVNLNLMRQSLAISFIYLAIYCIYKGSTALSYVFLLMGSFFHLTIFFVFLIIFLSSYIIEKNTVKWVTIIGSLLLFILGRFLPALFTSIGKYGSYATYGERFLVGSRTTPLLMIILFGFMLILLVYNYKEYDDKFIAFQRKRSVLYGEKRIYNASIYSCILGVWLGVCSLYINLFHRFMYNIFPFIILVIPVIYVYSKKRDMLIYKVMGSAILVLFFVAFQFVAKDWFGIDPYVWA